MNKVKWTSYKGVRKMKDMIKAIILTILFLAVFVGFLIYGSYRNKQIESGKMELIYQYGGDL